MAELRREHHDRLVALEDALLAMGHAVADDAAEALTALRRADTERAAAVLRAQGQVAERSRSLQRHLLTTLAREAPVASELRLIVALLHQNMHVRRMGELCAGLARAVPTAAPDDRDPALSEQVQEMGRLAVALVSRSLEAFARRDAGLADRLPALDDTVDRMDAGLFARLSAAGTDPRRTDWAMRTLLVVRGLERLADHAVDMAEQTRVLVAAPAPEADDRGAGGSGLTAPA